MKKIKTLWLAAAVILLIGLVVSVCAHFDAHSKDTISNNDGFLGATLNLSGAMWTLDFDQENHIFNWNQLNENYTVSSGVGGSGSYNNGNLTFSIGSPAYSLMSPINNLFQFNKEEGCYTFYQTNLAFYKDLKISNNRVRFAALSLLDASDYGFSRQYVSETEQDNVLYVYVNKDVTIKANGLTLEKWGRTVITEDLDIYLRAGWNALFYHSEWNSSDLIRSFSLGDPSHLKWILNKDDITEMQEEENAKQRL